MLGVSGAIHALARAGNGLQAVPGGRQEAVEGVHAGDHRAGLDPADHGLGYPRSGGQLSLGEPGSPPGLSKHPCGIHQIE